MELKRYNQMVYIANAKTTVIFCEESTPGYSLTFCMTLPLGIHTSDLNVLFSTTLSQKNTHSWTAMSYCF